METKECFIERELPKAVDMVLKLETETGELIDGEDAVSLAKDLLGLVYQEKLNNAVKKSAKELYELLNLRDKQYFQLCGED